MENRNKLMLKNTIFLYFRMFVIMCINLIAVRLLLHALGETDYGIFNVVGGVVAMLTFLSSSMSSAAQRFYACCLGCNDDNGLKKIFGVSITTFILIVFVTVILAETAGLWIVNHKLVIPDSRFLATNWVYQFSIITFSINMLCVPFIALVIASERMNFYTLVSIIDAVLKLLIIFAIKNSTSDRLILYSGLYMTIALANIVAYSIYIRTKFRAVQIIPMFDRSLFRQLFSYCSWYMFGSIAQVVRSQGINILLNMFFNPIINTARGLAYQVNAAVNMFVTSFYQAVRPQITKRYAAGEFDSMRSLVVSSTKLSYFLVLLISVPLLIFMPEVLNIWLKDYPENTVLFTRLVIIITMIETLGYPLSTAVCADGKIKWYQIVTGGSLLINLPLSYLVLYLGYGPQSTMYVAIGLAVVTHAIRMYFAKSVFQMDLAKYGVMLVSICITSLFAFALPIVIRNFVDEVVSVNGMIYYIVLDIMWVLGIVTAIGLNRQERELAIKLVRNFLRKK